MAAGVSMLSDLPHSTRAAQSGDIGKEMETANARVPTAKYTKMGETLRHVIPGHMQCSMACGGRACKYENPSRWSDEEQAVKGLYSSWITDNLLAMARPSTEIIEKYNVIEQFQRCGLKTVINLQRPGEHASCGNPLEQESGFTYRPETFMEAGIYYYNFGWKDYGVASLTTILDMVKVMSFAVQEGKMAVHCHAGLGRTGVLLACYLVFTTRMNADQAILFVRAKRPNSIQTRGQLLCVREFAQFLVPLRSVFACAEPRAGAVTLSQYLTRQRHLLHGYEARQMKNVPKIVQLVCRLLVDIAANRQAAVREGRPEVPDLAAEVEKTVSRQALQQLGKEMIGKGIPVPPCSSRPLSPARGKPAHDQPLPSDNELDPLWRMQSVESPLGPALLYNRSLSCSDSLLHKLGRRERHPSHPEGDGLSNGLTRRSLSHSSLTARKPPSFCDFPPQDVTSSIQDPSAEEEEEEPKRTSPVPMAPPPHKGLSSDPSKEGRTFPCSCAVPVFLIRSEPGGGKEDMAAARGEFADIPFVTLQSELLPEDRCLIVAKALALDLTDEDLSSKVTAWQKELNSREGAWERLCMERDPLVLSGLMWSWLEQLKEPVISSEDIKTLSERKLNPQSALDSLEKGHRLTLLCVLDCAAHLLPAADDVEATFLNQTIKVFTKIKPASEKNEGSCETLKAILTPVLRELRWKKAAEDVGDS